MTSSSHSGHFSAIALVSKYWIPILLIIIGAALRINGLARDSRLHPDEALFASYGRQLIISGDWNLYTEPIDKPPTTFALIGTSIALMSESEFAVRLPNLLASILSLAVLYQLAKTLSSTTTAIFTTALVSIAPLDIAYAPTAFQDPPMLLAILLSVLLLVRGRWAWGSFWGGVAFCMKPTAIYLLPLSLGLAVLHRGLPQWRRWWQIGLAWLFPVGLLLLWDESRIAQSFFSLGRINNNPGRFVRSDEVWQRAEDWLAQLSLLTTTSTLAVILLALSMVWLAISVRQRQQQGLYSWWIAAYGIGYIGWHWLVAFPIYDRYMLPLLPFALFIAGQGLAWVWSRWQFGTSVLLMLVVITVYQPTNNAIYLTDPKTGHDIDTVSQILLAEYEGQIVYDYALGWQLRWYLGAEPSVLVVFFPTPEQLAQHMQNDDGLRYLIAPTQTDATPWLALLNAYGIQHTVIYDNGDVTLVELTPLSLHRNSSNLH